MNRRGFFSLFAAAPIAALVAKDVFAAPPTDGGPSKINDAARKVARAYYCECPGPTTFAPSCHTHSLTNLCCGAHTHSLILPATCTRCGRPPEITFMIPDVCGRVGDPIFS